MRPRPLGVSMKSLSFSIIVLTAGISAASGADLLQKAPPTDQGQYTVAPDWAGFRAGVAAGYGYATAADQNYSIYNGNPKGGLVSAFTGHDWQFGPLVVGVEGDYSAASLKTTVNILHEKTDQFWSVRGRVGYVVSPDMLVYGTAGGGWSHSALNADGIGRADGDSSGWVAGAGLEYKIWSNLIARIEYLYFDFGKADSLRTAGAFPTDPPAAPSLKINVVRAGLSVKF